MRYRNTGFSVNIDRIVQPPIPGAFLEIKSRTWSAQDAERKAELIGDLLKRFDVGEDGLVRSDYWNLADQPEWLKRLE